MEVIRNYQQMDSEVERQDRYLRTFGLQRVSIMGDGNCLFRAVSFSLYGHQNNHAYLRNLAVDTLRANIAEFSDYFLSDRGTALEQINRLGQPNTYAGQECIYALAKALNINILVTFGGDDSSSEVITMENSFTSTANQNHIHIIWRRFGGGHYEAVSDVGRDQVSDPPVYPFVSSQDNLHTKPWNTSTPFLKKVEIPSNSHKSYDTSSNSIRDLEDLQSHLSELHSYSIKAECSGPSSPKQKHTCSQCKLTFSSFITLKKHQANNHNKKQNKGKSYQCMASSCPLYFRTLEQLVEHEIVAHGANIEIEELSFQNKDDFCKFKEQEEMNTNTRFVMRNKVQENKKKEKVYSLECHRNGCIRSHKNRGYQMKFSRKNIKGSCQLNSICPARFSVREKEDGKICVKYIKSHTHSLSFENSKFLPIPEGIKTEILGMLSLKIPINNIIDKIRERFSDRDHRDNLEDIKYYNLIDRRTIHNLKKKLADPSVIQHSNDAISTFLKVEMLKREKFNPVLLFKQQDVENDPSLTPGLTREDFLLVLMTKQQLEIYRKFANRIVCMDSTHKTNSYSFKLITFLVPDQFRRGYPVAFCISNREDETAIALFLKSVKSRSPDTKLNVIMTDDDNAGWNAARSIFGNDLQHYLCIWHIYRSWTRNVQQYFKNDEHKSSVFSFLCAMLEAKTEDEFLQYKSAFVAKLQVINQAFLKYMEDHYFSRAEKWAKCFRKGDYCKVDTNMFVESFHNQLKTIYFEGKRNRRIDVLLETLLKLENNLFINHFKRVAYNMPSKEDSDTQNRHKSSLQIPDGHIKQLSDRFFIVESQDNQYLIEICHLYCTEEHCYLRCREIPCIDLCYHMYHCNCPDYINGFLCKHVHKVHSMFTLKNNEDDCEDKALFVNPSQDSSQSQDTSPGQETQLNTIKTLIKQIEEQLSHPKVRGIRLPNIIQSLQTIKAGNEACINLADDLGGLKETEKISGNANNILQPRFHGTNKKKGRPKKVPLRKPSKEEKEQLLKDQNLPEVIPERRDMQNAPTVAPYPPLRLVPSSSSTDPLSREPEQSLFE